MKMCKLCGKSDPENKKKFEEQVGDEGYVCKRCNKTAASSSDLCLPKVNQEEDSKVVEKIKEIEDKKEVKEDTGNKKIKKLLKKKVKNLTVGELLEIFKILEKTSK